jgi:predicted ATPase/DNA-binding winged helix-turn-helix (wHTH) protein
MMGDRSQKQIFRCGPLEIDLDRRELRSAGAEVAVGSRAFGIIEILVQSAGEIVDKRELMRRVWAGTFVEENTLHAHISAVRKALGPDQGLLKTVTGRGYQLLGAWTVKQPDSRTKEEAPKSASLVELALARSIGASTNLPVVAQLLVGRADALDQLEEFLATHRIVTLTGSGGIGKTALAREVARRLLADYNGDVRFVELAAITNPHLVLSTVATALGLRIGGDEISAQALASSIKDRKVLIVLDSCEHLVDAVATLVETVTRSCSQVSILATSREFLRIDGEYVYRVRALDVPSGEMEAETALRQSAVQLFIARTKALLSDFAPRNEDLPIIASICRRLDGIPLAIEFAAARVATLGLQQVAERLDDRFALLTSGRRMAIDRHQTLRATLDWSYRLLSESEKRLFQRLAVFSGGFTLEAAAAIMKDEDNDPTLALDDIASLVSKSFLTLDGPAFGDRWRLLETIRAYALEKLAESGEGPRISRLHAEFFQRFMAGANLGSRVRPASHDITRFAGEIDNVRAALDWSFSPGGDVAIGVNLTAGYAPVWLHSAQLVECRERIERALNAVDSGAGLEKPVRMRLYLALGYALVFTMGAVERTRHILTTALELAESLDDREAQLTVLGGITALQFMNGESRGAREAAERFLGIALRIGDLAAVRIGERLAGNALQFSGRQAEAQARLESALKHSALQDGQRGTRLLRYDQHSLARAMLARVLWLRGSATQAMAHAKASLKEVRAANDQLSLCWVLYYGVFPVSFMTEDFAAAEQAVSMLIDPAIGLPTGIWRVVARLLQGKLMVARGEGEHGVALLKSAIEVCDRSGWILSYPEFLCSLARGLAATGQRDEAMAAIDKGFSLTSEDREQWYQPELIRTKGELLLEQTGSASISAATKCFSEAIDLSREQGALSWELRATHSLALLRESLGEGGDARQILGEVYRKFTEGFETPDLMAAKATLQSLTAL